MYNISDELRAHFENGERKSARITLNGIADEDLPITDADIVAGGFSIDRYCATGSKIEIGSAVSAELSLTLNNNDGRFNNVVFEGSILKVEIGIQGIADSYIPCGFFTIDEPPRAFSTIKLKALDFMMRFDKVVNLDKLGSNHTVETLIEKCAELCLVNISPNLDLSELPNADKPVAIPSTVSTYRQLLQWAAQLTGTCAYIDWNGELMLSWFVDTPVEITTAHRYSGDVLESDIEITGVTIKNESVTVVSGSGEYPLVIEGNGLIIDDEEGKVKNIGNIVKGFKYRPYECSCVAMPYLYPLDKIVYIDKNRKKISTVITNHTFGLNDTSSLAAQGETAAKNSYAQQVGLTKAEVDNAIAEAIKKVNHNTEYFYVRYSAYADGKNNGVTSMTDKIAADTVYLGTCATNSSVAPTDADSYEWVKIKPEDGKPGNNGIGIVSVVNYYLTSDLNTGITHEHEDWDTEIVPVDKEKPYLWNYEKITYTEGEPTLTDPCVIGNFAENGSNGRGIKAVKEKYYTTVDENKPDKSVFDDAVVSPTKEKPYLWNYEIIEYDDGSNPTETEVMLIGVFGKNGDNGQSLQVKYKNSASTPSITNNMSGWSDAIPAPEAGKRTYMTQKLSGATSWSTPIQISAEDGTTPTVTINSNGYWVINGGTTTVKAKGEKPTITVGENGNWYVDGVNTGEKAQGEQGKDGADIEYIYYRKTALGAPTIPTASTTIHTPTSTTYNKWTSSPCGITETYKYEYVSVRTKAAGSSTWGSFSAPVIWSKWGEKGTDGDGIEYKYFIAKTPDVYNYTTGDQTWTDEPTGVDEDWMYEYVVQIKHNGDGSTVISNPGTLWAKWGETGATGSPATAYSLISSSNVIAKSASGTLSPSKITFRGKSQTGTNAPANSRCRLVVSYTTNLSTWTADYNQDTYSFEYTIPTSVDVKAVRCQMYTEGGVTNLLDEITIPVVYDGSDAYTVLLSNESHTFTEGSTSPIDCYIIAYKGATQITTKITKVGSTSITATNGVQTIIPVTGLSFATGNNAGDSYSNKVTITPSSTLSGSGTVTLTIQADGKTFTKDFSYSVARKGATGDEGNGITSVAVTYATSTNGTTVPTNGWQDSVPSLSEGDYLWTKTVTNYKKTDPTTSYTVSRVGANGEKGKGVSSIVDYYTATTTSEDKLINGNGTVLVEEVSRTAGTNGVHHGLDDYYIIDMNQVNNSYCLIKLTLKLTATANVVLNCISCGEHNTSTVYDYMMVSNISSSDSTYKLVENNSADSGEKLKKKFNVVSEQSTTPIQVSFGNYSAGTYYIYIKARKDSSNTENEYFAFQCGTLFSGNNWTTYIPSDFNEKNPYLWKYTRINYDDGTHTETSKQIISHWGKTGKDGQNLYAEVDSTIAADTQTKAAKLKTGTLTSSTLTTGVTVTVKFTNANTFSMPNLNVNNTGNYQIKWNKVTPTGDNPFYWPAGAVMTFVYDGTYWVVVDVGATRMDMTSDGLVVGNYTSTGTLANNVLIGSASVKVRGNQTVYAEFGTTTIIGRCTDNYRNILIDEDSIDIRKGASTLASMTYYSDTTYGDTFVIKGPDVLDLTSDNVVRLVTDYASGNNSANAYLTVHSNGGHGVFSALTTKVKDSKTYQSSLGLTSESAELFAYSYIDNVAKESKVEVKPESITLNSPNTYLKGSLVLPNNTSLFAYKSDNTSAKGILRISSGNWVDLGIGLYNDDVGGTTIYGRKIMFYAKPGGASVSYKPYYSKKASDDTTNDSVTIVLHTTGYLKDAKSALYYTIPLAKPVLGSPSVSIATTNGYILYQNGNYINGSGVATRVTTSSCNAYLGGNQDLLYVVANFSNTTNAVANAPVGINVTVTITFT